MYFQNLWFFAIMVSSPLEVTVDFSSRLRSHNGRIVTALYTASTTRITHG